MTTGPDEVRKRAGVAREYRSGEIVVFWEPALCIHSARCLMALPQVFDPRARPWVRLENADPGQIAAVIESCPTGALAYERVDGEAQEAAPEVAIVEPRRHGPLFLRGNIEVVDAAGNTLRRAKRVALCRCGASQNKPYCDLSHRLVDFQSE